MSIFDDIRKDAEAGTPGPWSDTGSQYGAEITDTSGRTIRAQGLALSGTDHARINARRIARVPDLERIVLAAEEAVTRLSAMMKSMEGLGHGPFDYEGEALAAFRAAVEQAA